MKTVSERLDHILSTSSLCDAREIAEKLLSDIPSGERKAALAEVLPEWVRMSLNHRHGLVPGHVLDEAHAHSARDRDDDNRSAGWQAYGAVSRGIFGERWSNGEHQKILGNFTREDLEGAIAMRERHIEGVRDTISKLLRLRDMLNAARGAKRVGDLPEHKVAEVMQS